MRTVLPEQFDPADNPTADSPVFQIGIMPPAGGFSDEDDLPDPAIRLHAMASGKVYFKPADGTMHNRLILEFPSMLAVDLKVPWWQRWVEANCFPYQIIYENVDPDYLDTLLGNLMPGKAYYGLKLPPDVEDEKIKLTFRDGFVAGADDHFLIAEAGAVIGLAAAASPESPDPDTPRLLLLHARYFRPPGELNGDFPDVMNPREFLYLLFGIDSPEASSHPLLLK